MLGWLRCTRVLTRAWRPDGEVPAVELCLLGDFQLRAAGHNVDLGPAKQRILLAALAVDLGHPVPVDVLIGRVWEESFPREARGAIHTYIARVRRVLERASSDDDQGLIVRRHKGGYELIAGPEQIDLQRFRRLVGHARTLSDTDRLRREALLSEAVGLWRASALGNVPGQWAERIREALGHQRLAAILDWADVTLSLGRHRRVLERLEDLTAEYPLAESLATRLLRALDAAGRTAEALALYARTRQRVINELGTEPGRELRIAYEALLHPEIASSSAGRTASVLNERIRVVPAQLPIDVDGFVGRTDYLGQLDTLLAKTAEPTRTSPVISVISGPAGVGKTALALRWGHLARDRFADGQLYVNLRGFDPYGVELPPGEALNRFLDALGVSPKQMPPGQEARAALYRSLLANRRTLVVLDNARNAEQVRPLLPGSAGCVALVTSRNRLTGLIANESAHPIIVDLFEANEARAMLTHRLGGVRALAEPEAVSDILTRCGRLPLALAVIAARARTRPDLSLSALATELAGYDDLTLFDAGDPHSSLRSVFSSSYRVLSPPAARFFRLVGCHPASSLTAEDAAGLAGTTPEAVRPMLTELAESHLVTEDPYGRYAVPQMLRRYAAELPRRYDGEERSAPRDAE
jgi:DNA-binding SARP family transcriptional activator